MDWSKLKNMCCPSCRCALTNTGGMIDPMYECVSKICSFRIKGERFDEIVQDLYTPKRKPRISEGETNLGELNNWGRKYVSKDYSDSI